MLASRLWDDNCLLPADLGILGKVPQRASCVSCMHWDATWHGIGLGQSHIVFVSTRLCLISEVHASPAVTASVCCNFQLPFCTWKRCAVAHCISLGLTHSECHFAYYLNFILHSHLRDFYLTPNCTLPFLAFQYNTPQAVSTTVDDDNQFLNVFMAHSFKEAVKLLECAHFAKCHLGKRWHLMLLLTVNTCISFYCVSSTKGQSL